MATAVRVPGRRRAGRGVSARQRHRVDARPGRADHPRWRDALAVRRLTRRRFVVTVTPTTQTIPTTHTTRTTRTVARRRTAAPAALAAMLITAAGLVAPPAYAQDEADSRQSAWRFHTEPDLTPPRINTVTQANGTAPGEIFLAPVPKQDASGQPGKLIVDARGDPVWFAPNEPGVATQDFKMQTYRGDPVLTYWEGNVVAPPGYGEGEAVIMDSSYREIARLQLGGGLQADLHDVVLTERGTALLLG